MVSGRGSRALIAFVAGWMSVFAWLFTTASACIFCAQICVNLATLFHPDYTATQWQVYLIYVVFVWACTLMTIYLPNLISLAETVFFIASLLGFVVFFIAVLATSETKQPDKTVFVDWVNVTGRNNGTVSLPFLHLPNLF
jgi:choline transport protein